MAQYDYIRLAWSNDCNIIDNNGTTYYYADGFQNVFYFGKDDELDFNTYSIDDEAKETMGTNKAQKQVWKKNINIAVKVCDAVADILSTLPLYEMVRLTDKDGNAYVAGGADVTVDISPAENRELIDGAYYPIMEVKITIPAAVIFKTPCCTAVTDVECSDTVPTLAAADVSAAGVMTLTGTSPDNMLVRALWREWIEGVTVGNGIKMNDVCFVTDQIAYCCSNLGGIYKTTNGGRTWAIKYPGNIQLNGICFDGTDKIYAVGDVTGGQGLCVVATVGTDTFAQVNTGKNENLKAVSFVNASIGYCCGGNGCVLLYSGGAWSDVTPGTVTVLNDICTVAGEEDYVFTVGINYVCHSNNKGGVWTITNYAGETFNACCSPSSNASEFYFGNTNGDIRYTNDNGATSTIELAGDTNAIMGIDKASVDGTLYVYAVNNDGRVYYDIAQANTFANSWYIKGIANTMKRIRALTGTEHQLLTANGNTQCGTTETVINNGNEVTYAVYNASGVDVTTASLTTYEVAVQTFLLNSDPCETCATQLHTSHV